MLVGESNPMADSNNLRSPAIRAFTPMSDGGPTRAGAIGLIALATDQVCELDLRRIITEDRRPLYVSRIAFPPEVTVTTLGAMREDMTRAASLLLPGGRLDVIAYGCTSGTMVIGEDEVFARLREARPEVQCTTPPTAALAAFATLGMRRIAVLTPYEDAVNERVAAFLSNRGLEIGAFGSFRRATDPEIAAVMPESIAAAARALDGPGIDGIFLSCTALRALPVVEALEAGLGKPVVTSNQAMAWHALRLSGYEASIAGFGRLLRMQIDAAHRDSEARAVR
jgi:maleate isomerase